DAALAADLKKRTATGNEGNRLAFRFGDEDSLKLIPDCFKTDKKTFRNRGAVEDYWDKGVTLPHFLTGWFSDKPQRLAIGLLLCVGLLSIEWLTRELLKLGWPVPRPLGTIGTLGLIGSILPYAPTPDEPI